MNNITILCNADCDNLGCNKNIKSLPKLPKNIRLTNLKCNRFVQYRIKKVKAS